MCDAAWGGKLPQFLWVFWKLNGLCRKRNNEQYFLTEELIYIV